MNALSEKDAASTIGVAEAQRFFGELEELFVRRLVEAGDRRLAGEPREYARRLIVLFLGLIEYAKIGSRDNMERTAMALMEEYL